ncbi:MAG: hypothetical protein DME80_14345 [Verrucomicrobia bacterium]|nr:MAG: hypothetical protein DME80_14345 [Verrucomicrobiota bacterium]
MGATRQRCLAPVAGKAAEMPIGIDSQMCSRIFRLRSGLPCRRNAKAAFSQGRFGELRAALFYGP